MEHMNISEMTANEFIQAMAKMAGSSQAELYIDPQYENMLIAMRVSFSLVPRQSAYGKPQLKVVK
jgi:hypothetical protein